MHPTEPLPQRRPPRWAVASLVAVLMPYATSAHTGTGLPGGFLAGFEHPFSGIDHLLAMIAVGLWGAFLGRPLLFVLPVVFPAMMVGGAIMGMLAVPLPPVEAGIAVSLLVLGSCIALAVAAPTWAASFIVAFFAVFHGYAHGRELPSAADPIGYSTGFVMATGFLHVTGIGLGWFKNLRHGFIAARSFGAAIAVAGAWFLYRAVLPT